jgi:hypothetical protein
MVIKRPRAKPSLLLLDNESDYVGKALWTLEVHWSEI